MILETIDYTFFASFFILISGQFTKKLNFSLIVATTFILTLPFFMSADKTVLIKLIFYLPLLLLTHTALKNIYTKYSEDLLSAKQHLRETSDKKELVKKVLHGLEQDHEIMKIAYDQSLETSELIKDMNRTMEFDEVFFLFAERISSKIEFNSVQLILVKQQNSTLVTKKHCVYPDNTTPQNVSCILNEIREDAPLIRLDDKIIVHTNEPDKHITILIFDNLPDKYLDLIKPLISPFFMEIKKSFFFDKIRTMSLIDGLTQLYQRRYFLVCLEEELERAKSAKSKFSILMMDIDNFKKYNDQYGHLTGDFVLREIGKIIKNTIRNNDLPARYGGEEFIFFLPETSPKGAVMMAERLCKKIRKHVFSIQGIELNVTTSIGISNYPTHGETMTDLINTADKNLYTAKNQGKNQVI